MLFWIVKIFRLWSNTNTLVTVNFQDSERHGEYFRAELFADNTSSPVLLTVTNLAVLLGGTNADIVSTNIGNMLLPKASETLTYDLDGNLTSDSLWTNLWNANNQPMQSQNNVPTDVRLKLDFIYDYKGRRIQKTVSVWNGSSYITSYTRKFLYDEWQLIAVLDGSDTLLQSFIWANGLPVSITDYQSGTEGTYLYLHDGNRNVIALTSAANGSKAAEYNYGPFGNIIGMIGIMAYANPLRFSSEYYDDKTDLIYYIFRY